MKEIDILNPRDRDILTRLKDHYNESLENFTDNQIVGLFLQGSQNYELDLPGSDVDTKLIVVPSFKDIALARKPVSTTHLRANEEHIDFKDIRLYMETFRKQNLNFLEILFTPFTMINSMYFDQWDRLIEERESIARMNPWRAVKSMKGIALEKYHAMEHAYPSKVDVLAKHGYDPKQLHHLCRLKYFIDDYLMNGDFEHALTPSTKEIFAFLYELKANPLPYERAVALKEKTMEQINNALGWADEHLPEDNGYEKAKKFLDDLSVDIFYASLN